MKKIFDGKNHGQMRENSLLKKRSTKRVLVAGGLQPLRHTEIVEGKYMCTRDPKEYEEFIFI